MTREEAKVLLPIIKAFSEGKDIEYFDESCNEWLVTNKPYFREGIKYRIKPSPTYRPFANAEECWNEMLKHQPFGWVKLYEEYCYINRVCLNIVSVSDVTDYEFDEAYEHVTFADGQPFGVKESKV